MNLPTLSVLLPNYNHAKFVGQALYAILAQSVQPLEIIVIDDASTDNSLEVIEEIARRHPHIRVLRNETNQGVNYTLNRALSEARGTYIYGAAADDQVLPGFFERSLWLLAQHPQAAVCCSYPSRVDAATGEVTDHALGWSRRECYFPPADLVRVMGGHAIAGHTAIVRRDAFIKAGGWINELQWFTDWYALQVAAFRGGACFIPATLALFRSSLTSYYAAGVRNWERQSRAIEHLLRRLESPECRDVVPLFAQSGVLQELGLDAVRVLAIRRDLQTPLMCDLLRQPLLAGARLLLRDSDVRVRRGVAELLAQAGLSAWRTLPALVAARSDANPRVRRAARSTIATLLAPLNRVSAGLLGPAISGALWALKMARHPLQAWLRPPVAWLYRTFNYKLYYHLDRFEGSADDYGQTFTQDVLRAEDALRALRTDIQRVCERADPSAATVDWSMHRASLASKH